MGNATSSIGGMIGKLSGVATLAATGFGLGALLEGAVNAGESVYQLSTKMNITTAEASQLSRVLKLTGGDTGTFAASMMRLDKSYSDTGEAGEKTRAVLSAFGVTLTDSNGKLLPLNQQLDQMSKGYNLAAKSGQQEEFIMNTLGARGLSLVNTLKNLSEAKEDAAKVSGIGLDPKQLHDLKREMDVVSLQAGQIGLAFTGALAPIAAEVFPPIMSALQGTAIFLKDNKDSVLGLTESVVKLAVAYEGIKLVSAAGSAMSAMWATITTACTTSTATQATASTDLLAWQTKSIAQRVAVNDKAYAKISLDAQKSAMAQGLSSDETTALITANSTRIATEGAAMATSLRTTMTASYAAQNAAALENAAIVNGTQTSIAAIAAETAVAKTTATASSAEACAAVVVESTAVQVVSIAETGAAAVDAAIVKTAATTGSAEICTAVVAESTAAQVVAIAGTGEAAVIASETTVGAMGVAGMAVRGLSSLVFTLIGGWVGVAAAIGYAIYKLGQYTTADRDRRGKQAVIDSAYAPQDQKDIAADTMNQLPDTSDGTVYGPAKPPGFIPQQTSPDIVIPTASKKGKKAGKSDEEKAAEKAEKAYEALKKEAKTTSDSIRDEWVSLTGTQINSLDNWYDKELEDLNKSASANANYANDLSRLDEIYAAKKKKILDTQLKNSTDIWIEASKNARDLQDSISTAGLEGPAKEQLEMQNKYNDALAETIEKYKKLSVEFISKDKESQTQYLLANPDVTQNDDGSLNYDKRIAAERLVIEKNYQLEKQNYHKAEKDYEYNLDQAYKNGSIADYVAELNSERGALVQNLDGKQALMTEYANLAKAINHTVYDDMATLASDTYSGLSTVLENFAHGTATAADVFKGFASSVIDSLIKIQAQAAAASITKGLMGIFSSGKSSGVTASDMSDQGIMDTIDAEFFAGGGLLSGPGTGSSDSILMRGSNGEFMMQESAVNGLGIANLNYMNTYGKLPSFATGGLITGSSLSSVGTNYTSANTGSSSKASGLPNIKVNVNNYGNANVEVSKMQYDSQTESYIMNVMIDKLKNSSAVRGAAKLAVR